MRRPDPRLFPVWSLLLLGTFGLASLVAAVALAMWSDPRDVVESYKPDTFSRSSLGHQALVALLREQGHPVQISRYESAARARRAGLTMSIEPRLGEGDDEPARELGSLMDAARVGLIVLPKRGGTPSGYEEGYIQSVLEVDEADVAAVMQAAAVPGMVVRRDVPSEEVLWRCEPTLQALCAPALYDLQLLLPDPSLVPLIQTDEGVLFAEIVPAPAPDQRRFVLADPDLLANHGLHRAQNAALILAMVAYMEPAQGVVLIDEILHGYLQRPTLIRELGRFPLVFATLQFALLALLVLWAGVRRFGPPLPEAPPSVADKVFSIKNTAELVHVGHHTAHMTRRYLSMTAEAVAQRLGAPAELSQAARVDWLAGIARARGVREDIALIHQEAERLTNHRRARPREWLTLARRVWRWRRAMLGEEQAVSAAVRG
jgi:hypothetical protein